jgi:DNA-binding NtrC family response regulator
MKKMITRILVIADDEPACQFLQETLRGPKITVDVCTHPMVALKRNLPTYDLLIADIRMTRLASFCQIRETLPPVPLILVTSAGDLETAMEAVKCGAWDYISYPFSSEAIRAMVTNVLKIQEAFQEKMVTQVPLNDSPDFIGSSAVMLAFYKQVARVADAAASVLIEGESGTGKELTARSLHHLSFRRKNPFLIVHCGAIPDTLLESELFGYEKGTFTGADHTHPGLIESAQGGTLFLDEITEMAPSLQGKLLRFMQNGEVRRLGGHQVRHVVVRVVASTNRNLDEEVRSNRFRADLMYRFVVRLMVPSLRMHKEDLPQLVEAILQKIELPGIRIAPEAMTLLNAYDWPGNVRELENVLHQTHLLSPYPVIRPEHLPDRFRFPLVSKQPIFTPLQTAERNQILQTVQNQGWNRSRAARILGIDRKTLRVKMQRYGLEKEDR